MPLIGVSVRCSTPSAAQIPSCRNTNSSFPLYHNTSPSSSTLHVSLFGDFCRERSLERAQESGDINSMCAQEFSNEAAAEKKIKKKGNCTPLCRKNNNNNKKISLLQPLLGSVRCFRTKYQCYTRSPTVFCFSVEECGNKSRKSHRNQVAEYTRRG